MGLSGCTALPHAELPVPEHRVQGQHTDGDRDRNMNTNTDTDALWWIAKTELKLVWLSGSLGALHNGIIIIL